MNQVTNLVQWKNLTQEQKDEFDKNYRYEVQFIGEFEWRTKQDITDFANECVYRLVIEDDKWYKWSPYKGGAVMTRVLKGSDLLIDNKLDLTELLRPARPDEIPVQEKTLERKIEEKWPDKEVVMLEPENGMLRIVKTVGACEYDSPHVFAQSMKGFYRYVYDLGGELIADRKPTGDAGNKTIHPIAVLFEE